MAEVKIKDNCVICDIDGTLAIMGKRNPFNAAISHIVDKLNTPVAETLKLFKKAGYRIIFITGRETKYKPQTIEFIKKNLFWENEIDFDLYMRNDGDRRKDAIFKHEIFDKYINPKYKVLFALEDRNQMVDMYRNELGISCWQVNKGDF
jgi:hypothetical protein